jgi:hypothetical protein
VAGKFQDTLGEALRAYQAGRFVYKAPDGIPMNWRPADWLLCRDGNFIAVEAKQTRTGAWGWSEWTPQQRASCEIVERSGGHYWLVIAWVGAAGTRVTEWHCFALPGWLARNIEASSTRRSLTWDMTHAVPGVRVPWVPGKGWDVGQFLTVGLPQAATV